MSAGKYPFDMEVLTKQNQIVKGDWTYTLLKASKGSERVLIDNTNPKKPNKSVCVPLSAILELVKHNQ
tara:strand:- start:415 stop:618 length:204 start_codon:yes stop_codon:yes gene_type:complete